MRAELQARSESLENNNPPTTLAPPDLYIGPEYAVAEKDVREVISGEVVVETSLWRGAWRRFLKNKLALFGMIIVILIIISALIGPTIIKAATGYSYDFISQNQALTKSFSPFPGPP